MTLSPAEDFEARAFGNDIPKLKRVHAKLNELTDAIRNECCVSEAVGNVLEELSRGIQEAREVSGIDRQIEGLS